MTLARLIEEKRLRVKMGTRNSTPASVNHGCTGLCRETTQALLDPERRQHPRPRIIPHERDRLGTTATLVGSSLPSGEG